MKDISVEKCTATLKQMADETFKVDFVTLIRTKTPLFYVTTNEEKRLLKFMDYFCRARGYDCYSWDCFQALRDIKTGSPAGGTKGAVKNPVQILDYIIDEAKSFVGNQDAIEQLKKDNKKGYIYVLCDFFRFIREEDPNIERRLKTLASLDTVVSVVLTGPYYKATQTLENLIPTVDFPYPNKEEIKETLWFIVNSVIHKLNDLEVKTKEMEEELVNSVSGLTLPEAALAFSKSLVVHKGWNIDTLLEEKKQIIRKSGILEFYDNKTSLNDVGGLKNLTSWVLERKQCFSEEAEAYGLKKPKGLLTIGMPGCGKSLTCKAIANSWKMPLLRLDFGKLFGSLVGESEAQARSALKLAESVAPCVTGDTKITVNGVEISIERLFMSEFGVENNDCETLWEDGKPTSIVKINHDDAVFIRGYNLLKGLDEDIELKGIIQRPLTTKLLKITTDDGKQIKVTENHRILVKDENNNNIWKVAKDLKEKDSIITL